MTAWAPIEAPRLLADAARIMCPTMIDTDVPAPANRSDHPRMRGDRNNIIHKRLKSCGSSPRPTGGHGNKCKGGDGHHAIGFQAAKLRCRGRGTFLQAGLRSRVCLEIRTPSEGPLLFPPAPKGKAAVGQCRLRAIEAEIGFLARR